MDIVDIAICFCLILLCLLFVMCLVFVISDGTEYKVTTYSGSEFVCKDYNIDFMICGDIQIPYRNIKQRVEIE